MKYSSVYILFALFSLLSMSANAQKDTLQFTYERFCAQEGLKTYNGFFNTYQLDNRYFIEIPAESFNKDILISTQVVKGFSSFVSPASGVSRFSKGRKNTIYLTHHRSIDKSADSTSIPMMQAIEKSSLLPIDVIYPILSKGKEGKSYIIELTNELNSASGIFNTSNNSYLNRPDSKRSGIDNVRTIDKGVVFTAYRSQTDQIKVNMQGKTKDVTSTYHLEMLIQQLPECNEPNEKLNNSFYGFSTISKTEYDTKNFRTRTHEYISRWHLTATEKELKKQRKGIAIVPDNKICVYIDPITPTPFVESIKKGIKQWEEAFEEAGWKEVFRYSSDAEDASLSYRKILIFWGNARSTPNSTVITNPVTGEIIAARINIMDASLEEPLKKYYVQCAHVDSRIRKNQTNLEVRKEMLTAQFSAVFAEVLGLKKNTAAAFAFSLDQLHSKKWLSQYGPTASVTSGLIFNYVARSEDGLTGELLMPRVSIYDKEAIKYAYGSSKQAPSMKEAYYCAENKFDPFAQPGGLSSDVIGASLQGIENVKLAYINLDAQIATLPKGQNSWQAAKSFAIQLLAQHQAYLTHMVRLVGGCSVRPVAEGINETKKNYVPRAQQEAVLSYLEANLFSEVPQWVYACESAKTYDQGRMMLGVSKAMFDHFFNKDVLSNLVSAELVSGKDYFTVGELLTYFDRVVFDNFSAENVLPEYKQRMQSIFIAELASYASKNNLSFGLLNEGNNALICYFLQTAGKIKKLSETHTNPAMRDNYKLMVMKMNREFFDK